MRPEAETWWRQATADLESAQHLLLVPQWYAVSWFVQQAVEKGLKASYLNQRGKLPPRTHDLEFLGDEVQAPIEVLRDIAVVNPAFDLVRYPGPINQQAPVDLVTETLARQHFEAAERVMTWLDQQLNPPSNEA